MSESRRTPGPWQYVPNTQSISAPSRKEDAYGMPAYWRDIAMIERTVSANVPDDEAHANGHLMAAAPDLHAALTSPLLRQLLGHIEDYGNAEEWSLAQQWMELRDTALAKARGEEP